MVTFGDESVSTGWINLALQNGVNNSERAYYTVNGVTPSGEIVFWLTIDSANPIRRDADELMVAEGLGNNDIDSRSWSEDSDDEWIEFKFFVTGPGASDIVNLSFKELGLSRSADDSVEFEDGIGSSVTHYLSDPSVISSYAEGDRLEGLDPLTLSNVGGIGDGTWALRMTARAFGQDTENDTSFRVTTLTFEYEVAITDVQHPLPANDLLLHFDAASLIGSTDGAVMGGAWPDSSGMENNADSSQRPQFLADGGGGYPAVRFDGTDDYLEVPVSLGTEASVFIVFSNERSSLLADTSDTLLATNGDGLEISSSKSSATAPDYPAFNTKTGAGITSSIWVDGMDVSDLTGEIFSDRYYIGSAVYTQMPNSSSLFIGSTEATGSDAGQNDIREILVYDSVLTDAERREVEAYLSEKYRIGIRRYASDHPVESFVHILGSQQFGTQYSFGEAGIRALDYAYGTLAQGGRIAKFRLSNKYDTADGFTQVAAIDSLTELVRDQPEIKEILDLPFTDYQFWVSTFAVADWTNQIDESGGGLIASKRAEIYDEIYDLTVYLLETYSGTGKSFFLGNWEGDWKLAGPNRSDPTQIPATRIAAQIDWANTRQKAIDDAKAATTHNDVNVWYYLEANKMDWAREGLPCIVNDVIPEMPKLDFISFSSYSIHKEDTQTAPVGRFHEDLDRLQALIDAKPDNSIAGSRIIIGEYGFQYNSGNFENFEEFASEHALTVRNYLSWQGGTIRNILQWQFFNQSTAESGAAKEMSQIGPQNDVRPLYYMHENFIRRMRDWLADYYEAHGTLPSDRAYMDEAILQFDQTLVEEYDPDVSPWPNQVGQSVDGYMIPDTVSDVAQQDAAVVYDRYGNLMSLSLDSFDWSLSPEQQGLSVDNTGLLSIQGNASPGDYTISVSSSAYPYLDTQLNIKAELPVASIYDKLTDFSKTDGVNPNLGIVSNNAEIHFEGDNDRVNRLGSTDPEAITWYVPGLNRFYAKVYHSNSIALDEKISVETSTDGSSWTPLSLRVDPVTVTSDTWNRSWIAPLNPLPANTNYLRILLIFPSKTWNPQIGEVILFGEDTGYSFWKQKEFETESDRNDPAISGPEADPSGSGVSNLYRYFTDMSAGEIDSTLLPKLVDEEAGIRYAIPFDSTKSDVLTKVKASTDLSSWDYTLFDSTVDEALLEDGRLFFDESELPESDRYFFRLELSE
ncbi:MAG: hypothetical protein AAF065_08110 [Verrucomicrobiota bacterium]